jgi:hypothetical protein
MENLKKYINKHVIYNFIFIWLIYLTLIITFLFINSILSSTKEDIQIDNIIYVILTVPILLNYWMFLYESLAIDSKLIDTIILWLFNIISTFIIVTTYVNIIWKKKVWLSYLMSILFVIWWLISCFYTFIHLPF